MKVLAWNTRPHILKAHVLAFLTCLLTFFLRAAAAATNQLRVNAESGDERVGRSLVATACKNLEPLTPTVGRGMSDANAAAKTGGARLSAQACTSTWQFGARWGE